VSDPAILHPTVWDFVEAAGRCGLTRRDDFSAGEVDGAGPVQYSIRKGMRETSYNAFVKPVRHLHNLSVETGAQVCRILIVNGAAMGVEFRQEGQLRTVLAKREVILSAGAMRSPHILMLSGIGDGPALRQLGITPLAHLPGVGRNLQDHYMVRVQAETTPGSSYNRELRGWRKYLQGARYLLTRGGYLALGTSSAAAFLKSSDAVDYPDVEISFRPMTFSFTAAGDAQADSFDAISGSVYRVRPASRGEIRLRSPDPMDPPLIQPNYMSAPEDVAATIAGIRAFRRILEASPLASRVRRELLPGDSLQSDDELRDHVIEAGGSVFHPAGSCRMGNDELAVVDHRLRLRGVAGLRVVDASIMPVVTSGNTNAPTIMIGEKGADMIRAEAT
jgi:choline dehydrogenase